MFFLRQPNFKKNLFRALPRLEFLEARLVPAGEFSLHSLPGATKVIYLDFDGHTTTGTRWNQTYGASIITTPYTIDGDTSANFSSQELMNIREIWERVAEDFRPFNVDVTTEDPGIAALTKSSTSDSTFGTRVCVGGDTFRSFGVVGVAYLQSFYNMVDRTVDTPVFAFTNEWAKLGYPAGYASGTAETITHEVGHALGLDHDGRGSQEYYGGHGSGNTGWGPIMGNPDKNLTQWSKGEYNGSTNTEDDLAIITNLTTNGFGYRNDDYGSSIANASSLNVLNFTSISTTGIIERNTDLDFFRFTLSAPGNINININPVDKGPNLDIEAKLYNSSGTVLDTQNPLSSLNATFNMQLSAGTYYLSIDGVGMGDPFTNPLNAGYTGYGSLGFYSITGTIPGSSQPIITGPSGGPGDPNSIKSIPENSTNIFTFIANKPVTWSIAGGVDQSKFIINSTTGALSFASNPDFENPADSDRNNSYTVIVKATDSNGLSSQQNLTVSVTDVQDTPPSISGPSGSPGAGTSNIIINENSTSVFTFRANRTVNWSLAGGTDQGRFSINASTGVLSFIAAPDFENPTDNDRNNSYNVIIKATDSQGMSSIQSVTVNIRDISENPTNPGGYRGSKITSAIPIGLDNGFISGFRVAFNNSMLPSSFTSSDIFFTTPLGNQIIAQNPIVIPNSANKEFTFSLSTVATGAGTYNLKIGPDILDSLGFKMNQDGDLFLGENPDDSFKAAIVNKTSSINIENTRLTTLLDNNSTSSQITINQDIIIKDLNLSLNLYHLNRSDLVIRIKSPWGQIVTLVNQRGGSGDHFSNTIFDDSGTLSISSLSSSGNGSGTYRPESLLSIFNGKNARGVWTLTIEDRVRGNAGTLNSWKLNFLTDSVIPTSSVANSDGGTVSSSVSNAKIVSSIQQSSVASTHRTSFQSASFKTISPIGYVQTTNLLNAVAQATISPSAQSNAASQTTRTDALFSTGNPFSLFNF